MTFLRSPAVHHVTPDALGIVEYAERHNRTDELAPPYSQPSTQLFWDFCKDTLSAVGVGFPCPPGSQIHPTKYSIYHQFEVEKLRWDKGAGPFPFRIISTNKQGFRSRCVILAIGTDDCAYVPPEFMRWQCLYPDRILHASQFSVSAGFETAPAKIVIVGGGLTAGTLAKSLSERGHSIALIARKQLRTEQFDFPPVWLGPKALTEFTNETDFWRRYDIIQQNRGDGSITPDIMEVLMNAPNIDLYPETYICNIVGTEKCELGRALQIETTRGVITNVSHIILATGYQFDLRRYGFLEELITQHQIPLVRGIPPLDTDLQLHPVKNLFGSGTIAQLQIGPAAGNIAGVSLAYERLREKTPHAAIAETAACVNKCSGSWGNFLSLTIASINPDTSKVYPSYPNTVYLRYREDDMGGKTVLVKSGPGVSKEDEAQIIDGNTPPGIQILDYDTSGINPYTYLDLPSN